MREGPGLRVRFDRVPSYGGKGNHPVVLAEGERTGGVERLRVSLREPLTAEGLALAGPRLQPPRHLAL